MKEKITLFQAYPELSQIYWHPTKNGKLTPANVSLKTHTKVWWKCPKHDDHEWEAAVAHISKSFELNTKTKGCPFCQGSKVSKSNCLATLEPEIAKSWDNERNKLTPYSITKCSNKKAFWKCLKGEDHIWETTISNRIKTGCPYCCGKKTSKDSSLSVKFPHIANEWHSEKNKNIFASDVTPGSNKIVWWLCVKGHEYKAKISHRALSNSKCPFCFGKKLSDERSLAFKRPDLSKEFHPAKNDSTLSPSKIHASSRQDIWWLCSIDSSHEWKSTVDNRNKGNGCPYCTNRGGKVGPGKSLGDLYKNLSSEWDYEKNKLTPNDFAPFSNEKVWWICSKNNEHKWQTAICHRVNGTECPYCTGHKISESESLLYSHPQIAQEWHNDKNSNLRPQDVSAGSNKKVWWQCSKHIAHEWEAVIYNRTRENALGCPYCNLGWTIENIRMFVASLLQYIDTMTEAELYTLFQQSGLLSIAGHSKGSSFIRALRTGKFPKEELEKFVKKEKSLVDEFTTNSEMTLESNENLLDSANEISEQKINTQDKLQIVETKDILSTIDSIIFANLDKEAAEFFIKSAVTKIWKHIYIDEEAAVVQLTQYNGGGLYAQEVIKLFKHDYLYTKQLEIPAGYKSNLIPNLMQKHTAYLIKSCKRIGNWSGTGAGKTLSAILASRVINAKLTVICCPNNVVDDWSKKINETYPDSSIYSKATGLQKINDRDHQQKYLILNYDFFQQPNTETQLKKFLEYFKIDFVIIDEIHFSKQRDEKYISQRKKIVTTFLSEASRHNDNIHVLGMSATPVINNLFEGKIMIELVTGIDHSDLNTQPTISNCISLYQKFMLHGIRFVPQYDLNLNVETPKVDCSGLIQEIKNISKSGKILDLEILLTKVKLPIILQNLQSKTVIYTHYRKGIESILFDAISKEGWRVGLFNGDTKNGLDEFIEGNIDILIATSCVSTGIDGLQKVCNRLIINSLPWTHAEFEQLKGRIYRQGQVNDQVDIIIPLTFAIINDNYWSWCESRWKRIQFKKSIADAAIDGIIPEGHLRSAEQAYKDCMSWLERLDSGQMLEIERQKIDLHLSGELRSIAIRRIGDLSIMNQQINRVSSLQTHKRFLDNPLEWHHYHEIYAETRKDWEVIPYQEAIKWCKARPHWIIGDFGCGEAFLMQGLPNQVYSFDHIAINDKVISCDISHVPLNDSALDAAIFSLSLMGINFVDYLKEASRCLRLDGHLWIAEPTARIKDINLLTDLLRLLGFDVYNTNQKAKFTFIQAIKTERTVNEVMLKDLMSKEIFD